MINGAHVILYSTDAEADRAFLRDVLELPFVDSGEGWLIFSLPPAEVGIHPAEVNSVHEFFFTCDDIDAFMAHLKSLGVDCEPLKELNWGRLTYLTLPGGGKVGVYEAKHVRP